MGTRAVLIRGFDNCGGGLGAGGLAACINNEEVFAAEGGPGRMTRLALGCELGAGRGAGGA
ncbi:MAG: hypothetical protein ACHP9S_05355 [Terriglobales bacterium]